MDGESVGRRRGLCLLGLFSLRCRERILLDPDTGQRISEYQIHVARVVVQRSSIMRARPEIERWGCVLELEVDLDFTSPWQVEELLNIAGRISGVGDFRPEKRGPHGRYRAELLTDGASGDS